jgi:hypothetical protein
MARKADEGWVSKNGKPVHIPPYKAPRQKTTKGKDETTVSERVIEVLDSEDKGKGIVESDSEEETQLGLVWGSPGISETELQDSDVEEDNIPFSQLQTKTKADKPQPIEYVGEAWKEKFYPFVFITETEDQVSETVEDTTVVIDEVPSGETCVGKTILKEFGEGLFKGKVTTAMKMRGQFLYHVVYYDGDEENLNDQEFREAYDLFNKSGNEAVKTIIEHNYQDDSDNDNDKSGGEAEGSEYDMSEDEAGNRKRKKRRTKHNKSSKEKAKNVGENKIKRGG